MSEIREGVEREGRRGVREERRCLGKGERREECQDSVMSGWHFILMMR